MLKKWNLVSESDLASSGLDDAAELLALAGEARSYLEHHTWCDEVLEVSFAHGFVYVAVFHCRARTSNEARSEFFVVVGDVPALYFDVDDSPTPIEALEDYVAWMRDLCDAYDKGESLEEYPPLRVRGSWELLQPTDDLIQTIRTRMDFVERNLIGPYLS